MFDRILGASFARKGLSKTSLRREEEEEEDGDWLTSEELMNLVLHGKCDSSADESDAARNSTGAVKAQSWRLGLEGCFHVFFPIWFARPSRSVSGQPIPCEWVCQLTAALQSCQMLEGIAGKEERGQTELACAEHHGAPVWEAAKKLWEETA